jgi:hypothetical protein
LIHPATPVGYCPTHADSDIRPILHLLGPKAETLIAVRSQFALVTLDVPGQS